MELVDEKGIDGAADVVGNVGSVAKKLACGAKDLAETDRGAGAPDTLDLGLGRTEDIADNLGMLREPVPHAEGSREPPPLLLVRRARERRSKDGKGL